MSATSYATDLASRAYEQHGGELYRFARRWTGDDMSAQDLVQEVVVRAWQAADRFDPDQGSLRTWLFAIARNAAVDYGRSAGRRVATVGSLALAREPASTSAIEDVIRADEVARALAGLSADQRSAIVETYLRDRTYAEVAAEQQISQSTLRSRVFHGLRALRAAVDGTEVA